MMTLMSLLSDVIDFEHIETESAFHLTGKTGIASIATDAVNGKHVAGSEWRLW